MEYQIRTIAGEELEAFRRCQALAFGNDFSPERLEAGRPLFEFDRNLAAVIGTEIAGTAGVFSTEMTVPGGALPVAAVTMVSVKPTHRRRGILTGLMRHQLDQVRERGEPLAALWASESSIYGRFGYGVGIEMEMLELPRVYATLRGDLPAPTGEVRLLDADQAKQELPALHDRLRRMRPGELGRSKRWWDIRIFDDPTDFRDGYTANCYAVFYSNTGPEGYVRYRTKAKWDDWLPGGRLSVQELFAESPAAQVGLWRYIIGVDLIDTIEMQVGEMQEPLLAMLHDPRRLNRKRVDSIWMRVMDVEQALSGRCLATEGRLRFRVWDSFLESAGGTFELEGGPAGAVCRRTGADPEFELDAEVLASVYLGGGGLERARRVGRVTGDEAAIARAETMLGWHRLPHCQEHF